MNSALTTTEAIAEAGTINVLDQFTEMALGERSQFDFDELLGAMATAGVLNKISPELPKATTPAGTLGENVAINETSGIASGEVASSVNASAASVVYPTIALNR